MGDLHGIEAVESLSTGVLCRREAESSLVGVAAVNETILLEEWVKRVSMPSALPAVGDGDLDVGAIRAGPVNERRTAGFEVVHGILDRIMLILEIPFIVNEASTEETGYYIKERDGECHHLHALCS